MRIDIVTALPALLESPLSHSIVGRARAAGLIDLHVHDLRDFGLGRYRQVDDEPYGGGAGMVLRPEPLFDCLDSIMKEEPDRLVNEVIYLTPDAHVLTQPTVNALTLHGRLVLIAGHYKGIDQRVREAVVTMEISIGDYVLSGGELPACVLVDALARLIPGAISDAESALTDSFQNGLLDAPMYTRPASCRGMDVPEVLLSGNHEHIRAWREQMRLEKTRRIRPDMLDD